MRNNFFSALFEEAKADPDIVLITADMGFNLLEKFRDELPKQFVNSGISEANTATMAAGMALLGKKVFIYSITPFVTYRCLEQIRVDICYQDANVKIVGVGSGLDYAQSGATHHASEDIAAMRMLPNMKVVCPEDALEAAALPRELCCTKGPAFVRLGRGKEPRIHEKAPRIDVGKAIPIIAGNGGSGGAVCVISTGNITYNAIQAAKTLEKEGMDIRLFGMPWVKPLDVECVRKQAKECDLIVTVEEHSEIGGLRSAVCEALSEEKIRARIRHLALPDRFQKDVGNPEFLRKLNGLDVDGIARGIRRAAEQ